MNDLISRQAAIDAVRNYYDPEDYSVESIEERIEKLPSAQSERKTGKWIRGKCDQCGAHAPFWPMASTYYESDYCPNCGADMRGEDDA